VGGEYFWPERHGWWTLRPNVVATIPVFRQPARAVAFLPDGLKKLTWSIKTGSSRFVNTATYLVDHTVDMTKVLPYSTYPPGSGAVCHETW